MILASCLLAYGIALLPTMSAFERAQWAEQG
jgi:hypothetical protein